MGTCLIQHRFMVFEVSNLTRKNAQPDFIKKMLENIFLINRTLMNQSKVNHIFEYSNTRNTTTYKHSKTHVRWKLFTISVEIYEWLVEKSHESSVGVMDVVDRSPFSIRILWAISFNDWDPDDREISTNWSYSFLWFSTKIEDRRHCTKSFWSKTFIVGFG